MKKVYISRKRWCRGNNTAPALRTETGQSCCLGFVARAYGLKTPVNSCTFSDLVDDQSVSELPKALRPIVSKIDGIAVDTKLHNKLTEVNDDEDLRGAEREKKITTLMAKAGIEAIFID